VNTKRKIISGNYDSKYRRTKKLAQDLSTQKTGSADAWEEYKELAGEIVDAIEFETKLLAKGWIFDTAFNYVVPTGDLLYENRRFNFKPYPKKKIFLSRHRVGDKWQKGPGPMRVPYNLLAIIAQPDAEIELVEGEKGVEFLKQQGLLASCILAQVWTDDAAQFFAGRTVNINMDNDDAGRQHIQTAVEWLKIYAAKVRVIRLSDLGPKEGLDDWLTRHSVEEYRAIVAATPFEGQINAVAHHFKPEEELERYDWLIGGHLLRDEVSGTVASGGTGKSSLSIGEGLSMASNKQLTHDELPKKEPSTVILINLEDSRNTLDKRIAACMRHFELTPEDIGGRLITLAKGEIAFTVASLSRSGEVVRNEEAIELLTKLVIDNNADVLSIDSFIRTHDVNENHNKQIEKVMECFETIAQRASCAVHIWHHTRKANAGEVSVESSRGAQAFIDACRSVRVLETMTTKQYDELKDMMLDNNIIFDTPRGCFFRSFNGKRNFAPPVDDSDWYMFQSIVLNNRTTDTHNDGDSIGGRKEPISYYSRSSGVALALARQRQVSRTEHLAVGIVGLGAGAIAAYGEAGDRFRFYEINPQVLTLARTEFTYLSDSQAHVSVELGDARLTLEKEPPQGFDALIVDAFSGDAIPIHLLTREAVQVYRKHLTPSGVLLFHISNRFVDLQPRLGTAGC
jgi:AAA domain